MYAASYLSHWPGRILPQIMRMYIRASISENRKSSPASGQMRPQLNNYMAAPRRAITNSVTCDLPAVFRAGRGGSLHFQCQLSDFAVDHLLGRVSRPRRNIDQIMDQEVG